MEVRTVDEFDEITVSTFEIGLYSGHTHTISIIEGKDSFEKADKKWTFRFNATGWELTIRTSRIEWFKTKTETKSVRRKQPGECKLCSNLCAINFELCGLHGGKTRANS